MRRKDQIYTGYLDEFHASKKKLYFSSVLIFSVYPLCIQSEHETETKSRAK
jgi:hypothetical protein